MLVMGKVRLLRDVLRARQLGAVRVGTVDDYQGQEAKIIIISTVISASSAERHSSSRLGFMSDPKRFNVAISRAKASHASVTMSIAEITDVRLMSSCSPMLLCRRYSLSLATCMYDILQSSKSASSTQHTRGKYRQTGQSSNFFPGPVA